MTMLEEIATAALALPEVQRAELAEKLRKSLTGAAPVDCFKEDYTAADIRESNAFAASTTVGLVS
jgi:hypothetical protein